MARGLTLIAEGALDGDLANVDTLAERLGVGARHLRRLFREHLGSSPVTIAQTRRFLFAKQLLSETALPITDVAAASGFGSVRRFNEVFRELFRRAPGDLRGHRASRTESGSSGPAGVTLRLRYRSPYDWEGMLSYLSARAVQGVERVDAGRYARTIALGEAVGSVEVAHAPELASIVVTVRFPSMQALASIVSRLRRVFDLGADVASIGAFLARDPMLRPLLIERPGLRVPGGWDGFETAVRAVLGQQVSVEAGRRKVRELAEICGRPLSPSESGDPALTLGFPTPEQVFRADLRALCVPTARKQTLRDIAQVAMSDPDLFRSRGTVDETVSRFCAIRGVGEWTGHYLALRAAREPDAFPASDLGLLRAVAKLTGRRLRPAALLARAGRWRPWRGYAAQHLWACDAASQADGLEAAASAPARHNDRALSRREPRMSVGNP